MSDAFLGQVMLFGGNYAPKGWAFCQGQLLPIQQNAALYSLLGVTYGGNGTTNFALPDLRGRVPLGFSQGTGLSNYGLGQAGGSETVALTSVTQIPAHNHMINADTASATTNSPVGGNLATVPPPGRGEAATNLYTTGAPTSPTTLSGSTVGSAGAGQGHENRQPYLAMNYIIALQGIYPPRS